MKQKIIIFFNICLLMSLLSCQKEVGKAWMHIQNKDLYIWTKADNQKLTYEWDGDSFDKLIHGTGILSIYSNDSLISQEKITAYYGATSNDHATTLFDGSYYIGTIQNDLFEGFGVYQKGADIYVGTFTQSKPNGFLNWYKNGILYYSGEWANGNFHGKGILYKEDGSIKQGTWQEGTLLQTYIQQKTSTGFYDGYILNNKPDGRGVMLYNDSSRYEGEWSNGKWTGKGKFFTKTDSIIGEWEDGKLNGRGVYKSEKFLYDGDWLDNKPDGIGYITTSDSSYYVGEWSEGKRNGYGDMYFANSDSYSGDWTNNQFDGLGEYTFAQNGDIYHGEWKDGLQHGLGRYTSENYEYVGNWEEGWINGKGRITYANKDFYEGEFVENELYGQGYYQFDNGNSYEGEFVDGKFNGLGIFRFADGNVYEGEFQDGKIKGDGTLYYVEGDDMIAITANWDGTNNFPKQASVLFSNGDLYEGDLINGFPTENGIWTTAKERENSQTKIYNAVTRANDFYKKHRDSWNKFVQYTSIALTIVEVVEVAAPVIGGVMVLTGVGAPVGAALIATGKIAGVANVALLTLNLNRADAVIATISAGIDTYEALQNGEDATEALTTLGTEVAVNVVFIAAPKMLKSVPARKASVLLSASAKNAKNVVRKSSIVLIKNKVFGKIIGVSKVQTGKSQKIVKSISVQVFKDLKSNTKKKFESAYLKNVLPKTLIYRELQRIKAKEAIRLTKKEIDYLMANADKANLKSFIRKNTGNDKQFLEFFIRLADGDKKQVEMILNQPKIKKYIDDAIRSSSGEKGYHEWLMTSNFRSFLLDDKWGKDGHFLAIAQTKLIQKTRNVNFKRGGGHVSSGRPNSSESRSFHDGLAKAIHKCNSKEELFVNVRAYAKEILDDESYKEFNAIFKEVLQTVAK
ncbi:MAG: MORN repeat-containing protein [Tannerella sp.]|uniref:MORN repeat-containing protein n=1 Tax=Tannerella sp. TaxID=2382127 RepID=UPI003FA33609